MQKWVHLAHGKIRQGVMVLNYGRVDLD